ncbi:kinase-like protein [Thelephora ganbajun]|uniref:Kinase-like protein n=1 Tax=Thelephora ganbajun TaxID=370292 RepID=A0ACB6Z660_THEGA|nr:kinase-like protein [Thelephora ganbajun]
MALLSHLRALHRKFSVVEEHPSVQPLRRLLTPSRLEVGGSPTPGSNDITLSQRYARMAQDSVRSSTSLVCRWLSPGDVKLLDGKPMAAGGSADIWEATHDGRRVVVKSYRYYTTFDPTQTIVRFQNEVDICSFLSHRDVGVVLLVGVYSTETHPFGLVYEHMDGLDLRQYLRNEPNAGRLELLTDIARCLNHLHDLGIVHGNLRTVNILVDKDGTVRIAGLGNAYVLPHSPAWTADSRTNTDRLCRGRAPELARPGMSPSVPDSTHPTKASDMYAFGVMAFEILTGRPPFHGMTEIAAAYLMLTGDRPPQPDNHEISGRLWDMIERCWDSVPSKRMVVVKSYRYYTTFNPTQTIARFQNEVDICSFLSHRDVGVVLLVGVYSTETHPFGLVYEHMDGLDLRQYLRNEPNAGRLELLTDTARCLNRLHDLDIVHGDLRTVNILVNEEGTVRIAGLGNAYVLPHSPAWTADSGTSADRLSRSRAPELTRPGMSPSVPNSTNPTKASDMYSFGVTAFEILTGRPPFYGMTEIAAAYSMLTGDRPSQPDNHEISDRLWDMIERCWDSMPSKRMSVGEVVGLLEA